MSLTSPFFGRRVRKSCESYEKINLGHKEKKSQEGPKKIVKFPAINYSTVVGVVTNLFNL